MRSQVRVPVVRAAAAAALVGVIVYANALTNDFAYDDIHIIVENESLADPAAFGEILVQPWWPGDTLNQLGAWRPLTTAAFAVQTWVAGPDPLLFHAVNVLAHGAVSALVTVLAAGLVPPPAALLAGILFAVHPVHVEAVANLVGLAELLSAFWYLFACVLFLRWTAPSRPEERSKGVPPLAVGREASLALLYGLAFLAKESAATLPAAFVVLETVRSPLHIGALGAYLRRRGRLFAHMALVAIAVLVLRYAVIGSIAYTDPPMGARPLAEIPRIWTLGVIWMHYVRLLFFPASLSVDYGPGVIPVLSVWTPAAVAGATVVLAFLGVALAAWRYRAPESAPADAFVPVTRLPALALLWFLVTISTVSNVLFLSGVLLAERTLYLPSVGVLVLAGALLNRVLERRRIAGAALVTVVLVALTLRSWTRTPVWQNTATVFVNLADEHPESGRAQWMLGDVLAGQGDRSGALVRYRKAVGLLNSSPWLLRDVGWAMAQRGDDRLGEYLLRRALEQRPEWPSLPRRLAIVYQRTGRYEDAIPMALRSLENNPRDPVYWHILAVSYEAIGRWPEAVSARERAIASGEDAWWQWFSLARLRLTAGDTVRAERDRDSAFNRAPGEEERAYVRESFVPIALPDAADEGGS